MTRFDSDERSSEICKLVVIVVALALLVPFLIGLTGEFDLIQLAYFLLIVPLVGLTLLVIGLVRRDLKPLLLLLVFSLTSWSCYRGSYFLRAHGRWLFLAHRSKEAVLAQQVPPDGQLRHVDWDGWGMFAQDTEVYLVNDPVNSRIAIQQSTEGLEAKGVPCRFWRAYRLEPHWYALVFFTETSWDACTY